MLKKLTQSSTTMKVKQAKNPLTQEVDLDSLTKKLGNCDLK